MQNEESLLGWLRMRGDWLGATILMAILVASAVGYRRRSKGMVLLMSHVSAAILAIILFIVGTWLKYDNLLILVGAGVIAGGFNYTAVSFLIAIVDRTEASKDDLAGRLIDKVLPGKEKV